MKIVFVDPTSFQKPYDGNSLSSQSLGASWTSIIHLSRTLAKRGHEVIVLNHCPNPGTYDGVRYLTHVTPEDVPKFKSELEATDALVINRAGNIEWHDLLENIGITGCRKYLWCHDSGGAENGRPDDFAKYDKVISVSDWLNEINIQANSLISSDYFISIPLGVDTKLFSPSDEVNRSDICFVGAVVGPRRPQLVLEAFALAKEFRPDLNIKLHMIGSAAVWGGPPQGGDDQGSINFRAMMHDAHQKALKYQDDIISYSDIPSNQVAEILPKMGLMIYPTITETCGVSILEAQAAGVPVLVPSDCMMTAVNERIYHTETGIVRDFANMGEVAMAVVDTIENDHAYNKVRDQAHTKVVRNNDWETIADRWEKEVFEARSAIEIQADREALKSETVGVGILSFQNRELLQRCVESLKKNAKMDIRIAVWDNNSIKYSDPAGVKCDNAQWLKDNHPDIHLIEAPENQFCTISRNGIIEYFRTNHPEIKYMLFSDMDVIFKPNFLFPMVDIMAHNDDCAIVAYPEANCGFKPDSRGRVSEVMSICSLHRLESFDKFPDSMRPFDETFKVYSFDSWICQTLNLKDWRTYLVQGRKGYDHVGGQINQFLWNAEEVKSADVRYWQSLADKMSIKKRWEDKQAADYIVIGNTFKSEDNGSEAESEYKEGISRYPADATLHFCLANLYKDQKEWTKAVASYSVAIELNPLFYRAIFSREDCQRQVN